MTPSPSALSRAECLQLLAAVSFRCATGTTLHVLLRSASACCEIDDHNAELRTGWSVIIHGVTEPVERATDIRRLEHSGLDSLAAGPQPAWIRIRARIVTGVRVHATPATGRLPRPGLAEVTGRSVQEAALARVGHQLRTSVQADLLLNVRAMGLHRANAEKQ